MSKREQAKVRERRTRNVARKSPFAREPKPDGAPPHKKPLPTTLLSNRGVGIEAALRARVGKRDKRVTHVQFTLDTLGSLGFPLDPNVRSSQTGSALVDAAKKRNAFATKATPRAGDMVYFEKATGQKDSSLVGTVVKTDSRGTIEFVYIVRGIVRRGFVNPGFPSSKRDSKGRILNTFVRAGEHRDPRRMKYLAGELFKGVLRTRGLGEERKRVSPGSPAQ